MMMMMMMMMMCVCVCCTASKLFTVHYVRQVVTDHSPLSNSTVVIIIVSDISRVWRVPEWWRLIISSSDTDSVSSRLIRRHSDWQWYRHTTSTWRHSSPCHEETGKSVGPSTTVFLRIYPAGYTVFCMKNGRTAGYTKVRGVQVVFTRFIDHVSGVINV